jgi:serine/threonine protein kinase
MQEVLAQPETLNNQTLKYSLEAMLHQVLMSQASSTGAAFMADVYSFGVIIWEMFSGELPWAGMPAMNIAIVVTQERRLLEIPPGSPPEIKALLAACFQHTPTLRPVMAKVEEDFPEQDDQDDAEVTPAAVFRHEPSAYTISSQLTLSPTSTEGLHSPQVRAEVHQGRTSQQRGISLLATYWSESSTSTR